MRQIILVVVTCVYTVIACATFVNNERKENGEPVTVQARLLMAVAWPLGLVAVGLLVGGIVIIGGDSLKGECK